MIFPLHLCQDLMSIQSKILKGSDFLSKMETIPAGVTQKEALFSQGKMTLYRYQNTVKASIGPPLLIVYALVNRPYMIDLEEERSMVRRLLENGQDVYLIDWGYPDLSDQAQTLDDYINGLLHQAVQFLCDHHGEEKINLMGICQGGVFSLCYAALHREKINKLITMVTPVDFKTPENLLSKWVQHIDVDLLVDTLGNIPGELMNLVFLSLKPYELTTQKYLTMIDLMDSPSKLHSFMRMEKWIFDSPDQVGETYRQFIRDFYQKNLLITGNLKIGTHTVNLKDITMPVLNVYALQDHLVPPSASIALKKHVGSQSYTEMVFDGGHIGIYVSGKAQKTIPLQMSQWLQSETY